MWFYIQINLGRESGDHVGSHDEKIEDKKSQETVPLRSGQN